MTENTFTKDYILSRKCIHGGLRRSCETCDLADRLEQAEADLRLNAAMLARQCDLARQAENDRDALLAVLKRSLDWLASYPGECAHGAYEQARDAIEKAKGQ